MLQFSKPSATTKKNASIKIVHMPRVGIGTRKINASKKVLTREHLILVGTFQDYMNEIIGQDTSIDKDSNVLVKIIKLLPIVARRALSNIRIKRKLFVAFNSMLNVIESWNEMFVSSINMMHIISLEIESNDIHKLKRFSLKSRLIISS